MGPTVKRGDTVVVTPEFWLTPYRVGRHWCIETQFPLPTMRPKDRRLLARWQKHQDCFASVSTPEGKRFTSEKVCRVAIQDFVRQLATKGVP